MLSLLQRMLTNVLRTSVTRAETDRLSLLSLRRTSIRCRTRWASAGHQPFPFCRVKK